MAKINGNLLIDHVSGTVGDQLVLKRIRGGRTISCKKPTFSENRTFSEGQLARQQSFREAAAYAGTMKRDPLYLSMAEGTARTGYNIALADWLHPPKILQIDLSRWDGLAGGMIRVQAQDNVRVAQVQVQVRDESGAVLETDPATESGALWWEYVVKQSFHGDLTVIATAVDLPGHEAERCERKTVALKRP